MFKIRPWSLIGLVADLIRLKRTLESSEYHGLVVFRTPDGKMVLADGIVRESEVSFDMHLNELLGGPTICQKHLALPERPTLSLTMEFMPDA